MIETLALLKFKYATTEVVEAYQTGEISFDDEVTQACIGANFTPEKIELLKICADRLTVSHDDFQVVMKFITTFETMVNEHTEKIVEEHELNLMEE